MSVIVKICGLKDAANLNAALDAGADWVGFVFFPPSPRHLEPQTAAPLGALAAGHARKVALTVDADDALFDAIVAALDPDMLQLHGRETPERARALRARYNRPVMKALGVSEAADLASARNYAGAADWLLFDAKPPRAATRPGGNGLAFDWTILRGFDAGLPWMLSGGLDADNIAHALAASGARALDVSSGVESAPGVKDAGKIRAFIANARAAAALV
ncbi:MAG: phosphoribosylanthranilate isomerase [Hyphomicrobiales bacterium]|nr:phosphoribosylanthranilate isomerase [Hyphomicrobiales bacterium]